MATIASLNVNLTASSAQLRADLQRAQDANRRYARRAQGIFAGLGSTFNSLRNGLLAYAAVLGGAQVLNSIDQQVKLADQYGVSLAAIQELTFALEQSGVAFRQTQGALVRLAANLNDFNQGTGEAAQAFETLGFAASDLIGLPIDEQFLRIVAALRSVEDETLRTALASDIFGGRFARNLGGVLGDLEEYGRIAAQATTLTDEQGRSVVNFNDALARLQQLVVAIVGAAQPLLDVLTAVFNTIGGLNNVIGPFIRSGFAVFLGVTAVRAARALWAGLRAANAATVTFIASTRGATLAARRLSAAYGSAQNSLFRYTATTRAGILAQGAFHRVLLAGSRVLRGLRLIIAGLGGPIGLLIFAVTELAIAFRDQLVDAARVAVNFFVRQLNRLIAGINTLTDYFGIAAIPMINEWMESVEEAAAEVTDLSGALEDLPEILDDYNESIDAAVVSTDDLADAAEDAMESVNELAQAVESNIADSLTNAFETGAVSVRDFARQILSSIIRIQAQQAAASIAGSSFFGSIFGGARQQGGPVQAGQAYLVGEAGPELFVPSASGEVVSNDNLGGGANVTYNINAIDPRSFRELLARDPQFVDAVVRRGERARGIR